MKTTIASTPGITKALNQELSYHREGNRLSIIRPGGRSQTVEIPMRSGTFEHLSHAELYELAMFLRLKGLRSNDTHRAYVRQLERFLLWMRIEKCIHIDEMVLMDYQAAMLDPPDILKNNRAGVGFQPVSEATADQYLAPIRSFCTHLADKGLISYNPGKYVPCLALTNQNAFKRSKHFDDEQWPVVLKTLQNMPEDTPGQRNTKARLRFCILFGYAMALRISEQLNHSHADIKQLKANWVLDVVGKGRRARRLQLVTIDDVALHEIKRFRCFYGLSGEPRGERLPLLPAKVPVKTKGRGNSKIELINETAIADSTWQGQFKSFIKKDVMRFAFPGETQLQADMYDAEWSHLTPHSLRHTRITHLVNAGKDLLFVQKFAGHEKLDTTAVYFN